MTRKDYELIAERIRNFPFRDPMEKASFARFMADTLERNNPRFDRKRFTVAATAPSLIGPPLSEQMQHN